MFRKSRKNFLCLGTLALALGGYSFAQTSMNADGEDLFRVPLTVNENNFGFNVPNSVSAGETVDSLFSTQSQGVVDSERVHKLYDLLKEKTAESRTRRNFGMSLSSRIKEIENLKQDLANLLQNGSNSMYNLEQMMNQEIQERISRPARAAELNVDGSLNARGQARLSNDIEAIKDKYKNMRFTQADPEVLRKSNLLKNQIATKIRELESANIVESSLQNSGLELFFGSFRDFGDEEGWPYTLVYTIEGNEIFRDVGVISYKELSGRPIPAVPSISSPSYEDDLKNYEHFLDNVEVFNKAFATDVDFMEAMVSFKVQQGSTPSSYKISAGNVSIKNIVTSSVVKTFNKNKTGFYQSQPGIDVDLTFNAEYVSENLSTPRTDGNQGYSVENNESKNQGVNIAVNVEVNTPKVDEKQDAQKKPSEENKAENKEKKYPKNSWLAANSGAKISGPKSSYGSILYFLPGNICAYTSDDEFGLTLGYSLNLGLTKNFYIGMNAEAGLFGSVILDDYYLDDCSNNYNDDVTVDDCIVLTGVVGTNFSLGSWLRMSLYAEAGLLFDDFGAGVGASIELSSPKSSTAFNFGVTNFVTMEGKNIFKTYIGAEILW